MSKKTKAEWEAELDRKLLSSIDEHGWFGMSVSPRADAPDDGPAFTYSIGFETSLNQPNLIVVGLNSSVAHGMIWSMFRALKAGRTLEDGAEWTEPLNGYTCVTRRVHESHVVRDWFAYGLWYRKTHAPEAGPYTAYQLFWPGVQDRRLPWEDGCSESVISDQPRLDLPVQLH